MVGRGVPAEPPLRQTQISLFPFDGPSGGKQAGQGFQSCTSCQSPFSLFFQNHAISFPGGIRKSALSILPPPLRSRNPTQTAP
jgi:hypothetical protein